MMHKKGGFLDWFMVIAILFVTVVALFVSFIVVTKVDTTGVFAGDDVAQSAISSSKNTLVAFDNMMLFVIVGLSLFVIVSSAFVFNHPAFFVVGFFLLCIAVTLAAITANTYSVFSEQSVMSGALAAYPKVDFLMRNLPLYIAFMGMAASVVMFVAYSRLE